MLTGGDEATEPKTELTEPTQELPEEDKEDLANHDEIAE